MCRRFDNINFITFNEPEMSSSIHNIQPSLKKKKKKKKKKPLLLFFLNYKYHAYEYITVTRLFKTNKRFI